MTSMLRATASALTLLTLLTTGGALRASTWKAEVIDVGGEGHFSSMRIDSQGNIHLAYVLDEDANHPLKYAFWDHALKRWFIMTVAEPAGPCSLALDSKQRPRISWVNFGSASGSSLHYAYWDGATWQKQALPLKSDIISYYNSLALDRNDRPSISFYEYRGPKDTDIHIRLRVVSWDGEVWRVITVDPQEGSGKFNSLGIDAEGRIHVAYANVAAQTSGLRYALWDGKKWTTEIVDDGARNDGATVGYSVAMALDADGNPHVTYMNMSKPAVKYAVRRSGRWQTQTVDRLFSAGYPDRNSIAIGPDGRPYIAYYDAGAGELRLAYVSGKKWMIESLDSGGFTSSIQIHNGEVWISYANAGSGGVKIIHAALPTGEPPVAQSAARP